MTDFRALCAELLHAVQSYLLFTDVDTTTADQRARRVDVAMNAVRAALAHPAPPAEALAVRPLLEKVARLGDRIGANSVGEIMAISSRAAAWLEQNPPGQPVALEPRGCPTPGACSCVEPAPPAEGEVGELVAALRADAECVEVEHYDLCNMTADQMRRAADLLEQRHPAPVPVAIPGEEYHEDMGAVTWWRFPVDEPPWVGTPNDSDWPGYHTHFTPAPPEPATALPLPAGEVK